MCCSYNIWKACKITFSKYFVDENWKIWNQKAENGASFPICKISWEIVKENQEIHTWWAPFMQWIDQILDISSEVWWTYCNFKNILNRVEFKYDKDTYKYEKNWIILPKIGDKFYWILREDGIAKVQKIYKDKQEFKTKDIEIPFCWKEKIEKISENIVVNNKNLKIKEEVYKNQKFDNLGLYIWLLFIIWFITWIIFTKFINKYFKT